MANEQNLIKNEDLTPSQRREHARKAGIASGKARRERKALKDTLEELLAMPIEDGKLANINTIKSIADANGKNVTMQEAIMLAMLDKAVKGDVRAAEYVRDTIGQKPDNKTDVSIKTPVVIIDDFNEERK